MTSRSEPRWIGHPTGCRCEACVEYEGQHPEACEHGYTGNEREGCACPACGEVGRLRAAMRHVINDSPGTPDSVKTYLLRELEGSWGEPYEERMTRQEYERATLDDALYDAREYLVAGLENQAEWWEHLGDAHRDYAALARLAVAQADELAAQRA